MRALRIESQAENLIKIADMIKWNSKRIELQRERLSCEIGLFFTKKEVVDRLEFLIEIDLRLRNYMKAQAIKLAELC